MYTLRKITDSGTSNSSLGKTYVRSDKSCAEWKTIRNVLDWMDKDRIENVEMIIFDEKGQATPVFKNDKAYIMTENGRTFERLTV